MRYPLYGCDDGNVLDGGYDFLDQTDGGATFHPGVDLNAGWGGDADRGALISNMDAGVVRHITYWDGRQAGFGTHLWVEHDDGHWAHHAHLEAILTTLDQRVERGDLLARCGKSGWQAWAHDHFEVTRSRPQSFTQWPRGWSRDQVEAEYRNPHDWLLEKEAEANAPQEEDPEMLAALQAQVAEISADRDKYIEANAFNERKALHFESVLREPVYRKVKRGKSTKYQPIGQADIDAAVAAAHG